MRILIIFIITILPLFLSQCISYDFSRRIVQQGNLIPKEKIERLKLGMPKENVAILMGTSLLNPMFNNERWDYAYTWRRGSGKMEKQHITLFFTNGRLSKIEQLTKA